MSIRVNVTASSGLRARAEAAAQRATKAVMVELNAAMQQSFTAKSWSWPGETARGGGSVVSSPRNIIDTGNLGQSSTWQMTGPYQATFAWSANYATAVHEGARIRPWGNPNAALVTLPARPWTRAVLGQETVSGIKPFPFEQRLKDVWLAYFKASR